MVALAFTLAAAAADADKLDKDAERWLRQVHLLILPDEEATFRALRHAADRKEFERVFWARRDPVPATEANEREAAFARARARADELFALGGRKGSETGCGQVLALLGEPLEVEGRELEVRFDSVAAMREGARRPEVWTYRSRPGDAIEFTGGELRLAFDEECRFDEGGRTLDDLRRIARARVVRPELGHRGTSVGRALLASPRADFPLVLEPKLLLRTQRGEGYVAGLVRADRSGLRGPDGAAAPALAGTVVAQAIDAAGRPSPAVERAVRAAAAADGTFTTSYGLTLKPGRYTLTVGLVAGEKASVTSRALEVPDYDAPGLKLGSLVVYTPAAEASPPDAAGPYAAFTVGPLRLQPHPGNVFERSDALLAVCPLYGGQPDASTRKPSLRARFTFLRDERPVARGEEETFDTPMAVASIGPVPLATFAPGRYVARVEVTDTVAGTSQTQDTAFEIR